MVWLWETFEPKTKLPKIEKGALVPGSNAGKGEAPPTCVNSDVIKGIDFFHHVRNDRSLNVKKVGQERYENLVIFLPESFYFYSG